VKFDVSGLSGAPLKAVLRLWAETTGTTMYKVYQVTDSSWTEGGLTFATKPAFGGLLGTSGVTTAGTWMDLDVTGAVNGNGLVTLGFTTGRTAGKNFGSREDIARAPQLLLTAQPPANSDPVVLAWPLYPGGSRRQRSALITCTVGSVPVAVGLVAGTHTCQLSFTEVEQAIQALAAHRLDGQCPTARTRQRRRSRVQHAVLGECVWRVLVGEQEQVGIDPQPQAQHTEREVPQAGRPAASE
jgi:hypothetical protein